MRFNYGHLLVRSLVIILAVLLFFMFDFQSKGQLFKYSEDNVAMKFSGQYNAFITVCIVFFFLCES